MIKLNLTGFNNYHMANSLFITTSCYYITFTNPITNNISIFD